VHNASARPVSNVGDVTILENLCLLSESDGSESETMTMTDQWLPVQVE
jgi:hypothetical protein